MTNYEPAPKKQQDLDFKWLAMLGANFSQTPKRYMTFLNDLYEYSPNELDLQEFLNAKRTEYGLQPIMIDDIVKSKHT